MEKEIGLCFVLALFLSGCPLGDTKNADSSAAKDKGTVGAGLSTQKAKRIKANSELLWELYVVVRMKKPTNRSRFGNWLDSINQGASIEGVYNAFTHSNFHRMLEAKNPGASARALRVFGEELARLSLELPKPSHYDASSAKPLPVIDISGQRPKNSGHQVIDFSKKKAKKVTLSALADQYSRTFVGASIFTLKRVLGDEALKVIHAKSSYPEKLALWYSQWAVKMTERKINFGLKLRNRPDEAFHYKWAVEHSPDYLKWEVLNRLHRVLNESNQQN